MPQTGGDLCGEETFSWSRRGGIIVPPIGLVLAKPLAVAAMTARASRQRDCRSNRFIFIHWFRTFVNTARPHENRLAKKPLTLQKRKPGNVMANLKARLDELARDPNQEP